MNTQEMNELVKEHNILVHEVHDLHRGQLTQWIMDDYKFEIGVRLSKISRLRDVLCGMGSAGERYKLNSDGCVMEIRNE